MPTMAQNLTLMCVKCKTPLRHVRFQPAAGGPATYHCERCQEASCGQCFKPLRYCRCREDQERDQ